LAAPAPALPAWLDAVVADVDGAVLTASDIALARALSLFGFAPSVEAIRPADVERLVDARLAVREAIRLRVPIAPEEEGEAWRDAATRVGGAGALARWLEEAAVDPAWAREAVRWDLVWRRFGEVRFQALAFVTEGEISDALGPGAHGPADRDRMRARLVREAALRELSAWLVETRSQARVVRPPLPPAGLPMPFPMPGSGKE
jgi:hypothetical protein